MPRHQEPKKDVTSCEKPRVGAHIRRNVDIRMGKPDWEEPSHSMMKKIVIEREPGELKHLSTRRKRKQPRYLK